MSPPTDPPCAGNTSAQSSGFPVRPSPGTNGANFPAPPGGGSAPRDTAARSSNPPPRTTAKTADSSRPKSHHIIYTKTYYLQITPANITNKTRSPLHSKTKITMKTNRPDLNCAKEICRFFAISFAKNKRK